MIKKNDIYTVNIIDLTYEGMGLAKVEGFPIFIENALPGEEVEIKIVKVLKKFGFGIVVSYLSLSSDRVDSIDKDGYRNGTMPLQHLAYPKQLEFKRKLVEDSLRKHISLEGVEILPTIGMENPWQYRNKAQIPVKEINGILKTGFFKKNSHELIPIENYYIQDPIIDETILQVRDILRHYGISAYDEISHKGIVRNIIVRKGHYTNEIMIILVTNGNKLPHSKEIVNEILKKNDKVVSIIQNINDKKGNVIMGPKNIILYGEDIYTDTLLDKKFLISSKSFYQINTIQTEKLYKTALEYAQITKNDVVLDAYSGIGTIGILASDKAQQVYGVEVVEDAIKMAHRNEELNEATNTTYLAGKAEEVIMDWYKEGIYFDVVIVDPPRKGLDKSFIDTIGKIKPERVVYVSCNPATLARDLELFVGEGYTVEKVQPVDMFPQTVHVESVVSLNK